MAEKYNLQFGAPLVYICLQVINDKVGMGKCTHGASVLFANNCLNIHRAARRGASVYGIFGCRMQTTRPFTIKDGTKIR
jgi:hypothetical protein